MSSLLSEAERAGMRATLASHRDARVVVQVSTRTSDGQGGKTETWSATATVDAYIEEQVSRGERAEGGRPVSINLWMIELPRGTVVDAKARLISGGVTYEVLSIDNDPCEQLAVYCTCRKAV